jgi:hypothetical protein
LAIVCADADDCEDDFKEENEADSKKDPEELPVVGSGRSSGREWGVVLEDGGHARGNEVLSCVFPIEC